MHGAAVRGVEIFARRLEIFAPAGFVAERPHNDGRSVFIPFVHSLLTMQVYVFIQRIVRKIVEMPRIAVIMYGFQSVRFDIRLFENVNPVLVAKFRKKRMRRIMRRSHGVYVVFAEKSEVLFHQIDAFRKPVGRHGMSVHAFEFHGRAVDF